MAWSDHSIVDPNTVRTDTLTALGGQIHFIHSLILTVPNSLGNCIMVVHLLVMLVPAQQLTVAYVLIDSVGVYADLRSGTTWMVSPVKREPLPLEPWGQCSTQLPGK